MNLLAAHHRFSRTISPSSFILPPQQQQLRQYYWSSVSSLSSTYPSTTSSSVSATYSTDICVIGAGVIGLAIARALTLLGSSAGSGGGGQASQNNNNNTKEEILIIDQAETIGSETSSRNSEVIHGGLYYPQNSLKARLCVEGKHRLYAYCTERNISFTQCGKLIVATRPSQRDNELQKLLQQAHQNGVTDVRLLSTEDVHVMEPHIHCTGGALWSPSTGVFDSHSFMRQLLIDAEDGGATLILKTKVKAIHMEPLTGRFLVHFDDDENTCIVCNKLVNAAGLWAPNLARSLHGDNLGGGGSSSPWYPPKGYFARGTYFLLHGIPRQSFPFRHLIYPVPEPGGLGVHATIDWAGQSIRFGPDVEWIKEDEDDPSMISLSPDPERGNRFYDEVRKYWPDLPDNALIPDYVGIRPKLNHPSNGPVEFQDFLIAGPKTHGIKGLVHLLGIESPGLTSSMAIGDYVTRQL